MTKLMSIIVGGALGLTLAASVGAGIVVGSNTEFMEARAATSVSTLSFSAKCNGSGTANDGAAWTITSDSAESSFDSTKGIHYGTSNAAVSYVYLRTSDFTTAITKIVVYASGASGTSAKLNVKVGNSAFGTQKSLTKNNAAYTFEGSKTGDVSVELTQSSTKKAIYCKSIEVTYTVPEVSSITVGGTMTKTVYFEGDNWDPAGLTVTANFTNNTSKDVTNSASWSFDPASANSTSITSVVATATYDGKTANSSAQSVTVNEVVTKTYNLVNSANELQIGAQYLIANAADNGNAKFLSSQNNNNRSAVQAPVSNNVATITTQNAVEVTLGGSAGSYTLLTNDGYLYAAGGSENNYLRSRSNNADDNGVWTIAINSGVATITAKGDSTRNIIRYNSSNDIFSCYASGQSDIYLYKSASAYATSISVSGSMSLTTYTTASEWDPTGLTVTATMSDSSTEDITNDVTWSFDPALPAEGVTSVIATATYGELTANSASQNVTVVVVSSPYVNGTPYKMYFLLNNVKQYFTGSMGTGSQQYYGATTTDISGAIDVYFEANGDGQNIYFDKDSARNYIKVAINDTHKNFVFDTAVPTTPWIYDGQSVTYTIEDDAYTIGSYSTYNTISAFPASYNNYKIKFDLSSGMTAEGFSTLFLSEIVCDSTGASAPTYANVSGWNDLYAVYSQLNATEQLSLRNAAANESGTTVEQAMARYDYVVAKYGYTNFIGRTISNSAHRMNGIIDNNAVVVLTASLALLSTTAFAAFYMLRKKKSLVSDI